MLIVFHHVFVITRAVRAIKLYMRRQWASNMFTSSRNLLLPLSCLRSLITWYDTPWVGQGQGCGPLRNCTGIPCHIFIYGYLPTLFWKILTTAGRWSASEACTYNYWDKRAHVDDTAHMKLCRTGKINTDRGSGHEKLTGGNWCSCVCGLGWNFHSRELWIRGAKIGNVPSVLPVQMDSHEFLEEQECDYKWANSRSGGLGLRASTVKCQHCSHRAYFLAGKLTRTIWKDGQL